MPAIPCPNPTCGQPLNISDTKMPPPGTQRRVACPHCKHQFNIGTPAAVTPIITPVSPPLAPTPAAPVAAPTPAAPVAPLAAPLAAPVAPPRPMARAVQASPPPQAKADAPPTAAPTPAKKSPVLLVALLAGGGFALLAVAGVIAVTVWMMTGKTDTAKATTAAEVQEPQGRLEPTPKGDRTKVSADGPKVEQQRLAPEAVYDRAVRGCVFVECDDGQGRVSFGTGWLADRQHKVVVTAWHVIDGAKEIKVHFPQYDAAGKPERDVDAYRGKKPKQKPIPAEVVKPAEGRSKDVAVLELQTDEKDEVVIPDRVRAVPLAPEEAAAAENQQVFTIGSSDVKTGRLWVANDGRVRSRAEKRATEFATRVIEYRTPAGETLTITQTQNVDAYALAINATNKPGDSGGPVLNDRAEVVGLVSSRNKESVVYAIDVKELRVVLRDTFKGKGWEWDETATGVGVVATKSQMADWVRQMKEGETADERRDAARKLGEMGIDAQPAVPDLVDRLIVETDERVREVIAAALDAVGRPGNLDLQLLVRALQSASVQAQRYAAGVYGQVNAPREAFPTLLKLIEDDAGDAELRRRAVLAFKQLGPECKRADEKVLDNLLNRLGDSDRHVADAAAETLTHFVTVTLLTSRDGNFFTQGDIPTLRHAAKAKSDQKRRIAALGYKNLAKSADDAFDFYHLDLFNSGDPGVRKYAIEGVLKWAQNPRFQEAHRAAIMNNFDHGVKTVRLAVLDAAKVMPWDKDTSDRLVRMAEEDTDPDVRGEAFKLLTTVDLNKAGLSPADQLDLFQKMLNQKREPEFERLRGAVRFHEGKDRTIKGPTENVKAQEEQAAKDRQEHTADETQLFNLRVTDTREKVAVIEKLGRFGSAAAKSVDELLRLFETYPSTRVKIAALDALRSIIPGLDADAKRSLLTRVSNLLAGKLRDHLTLEHFSELHEDILDGYKKRLTQPQIVEKLNKNWADGWEKKVFPAAVKVLAAVGEESVPLLTTLFVQSDVSAGVKTDVMIAFRDMGPKAASAVTHLVSQAKSNKELRDAAREALARIGGDHAVEQLKQCTAGTLPVELRLWAFQTLGELDPATLTEDGCENLRIKLNTGADREASTACRDAAKLARTIQEPKIAAQKKALKEKAEKEKKDKK